MFSRKTDKCFQNQSESMKEKEEMKKLAREIIRQVKFGALIVLNERGIGRRLHGYEKYYVFLHENEWCQLEISVPFFTWCVIVESV